MNEEHDSLCSSPEWAEFLQADVLPPLADGADLGKSLLEIGPGPGAATDWLRHRVARLVAVEQDRKAAGALAARFADSNVEIVCGDASDPAGLRLDDDSFDSAACFTMLHHVPTTAGQNAILANILRALRPGGVLIGSDSLPGNDLHHFHHGDTYNPVEPGTLLTRLQCAGYGRIMVSVADVLTFIACKPAPPEDSCGQPEDC